jgi:hypothetical protein
MRTKEDAIAVCQREHDPFYLDAFMIEAWLGQVVLAAAAEYAEKKNANERLMQVGEAWRSFLEIFGRTKDDEFHHVLTSLYRFAEHDDVQAEILRGAIVPLSFEHECFSDFIGPKTMNVARQPREAVQLMRRSIQRWCDWIDANAHFQAHEMWHLSPTQFDPDPEKRELAALGVNQSLFPHLSDFSKQWWHWHHGEAAERFKDSPKWRTVGQAMAATQTKAWDYPELDQGVIMFWPLVKRYNWTYLDLLNVIRQVAPRPEAHPCENEQTLSTYCLNVLGLRKAGRGKTTPAGKPTGYEVALRLCGRQP